MNFHAKLLQEMQTFVNQQNEAFTDEEDFSANEDEDSAELEMMDSGIVMDSVNWEKIISWFFFRNVQNCKKSLLLLLIKPE